MNYQIKLSKILIPSLLALILVFNESSAQSNGLLEVFENQVEAFNNKDIDQLVTNVSDDFKWYYISSDTLTLEVNGKAQFKESMISYFEHIESINSVIKDYTIDGPRISFQEEVTYETKTGAKGIASAMGVYEIRDGLIFRVWYFY